MIPSLHINNKGKGSRSLIIAKGSFVNDRVGSGRVLQAAASAPLAQHWFTIFRMNLLNSRVFFPCKATYIFRIK